MLIIMFLGLAGLQKKQHEGQQEERKTYASYRNSTGLEIKEGEYHNSSDVLMSNFPNAEFKIITTQAALAQQRKIFDDKPSHLSTLENHILLQNGSETDEIFSAVFEAIRQSGEKQIIIDITHGMRNHPVMASFGATLARVDSQADIKLLFAKELVPQTSYEYIFLDKYNDIGLNALLLKSFNSTLGMPSLSHTHPFIEALQLLSNHLHTNAFHALFTQSLLRAMEHFGEFAREYRSLETLCSDTQQILNDFKALQNLPSYQQYLAIAHIMLEKGYYLVSVTYGFEALPKYLLEKFEQSDIIKDEARDKSPYDKSQAINQFVLSDISKDSIFAYDKACYYRDCFKEEFEALRAILQELKDIRNSLAHIDDKAVDMENIKPNLERLYTRLDDLCMKRDVLKAVDTSCLYSPSRAFLERVSKYFLEEFKNLLSVQSFDEQKESILTFNSNKSIKKDVRNKFLNDKRAQKITQFMCKHKESKYLTKEQGAEFEACFNPNIQAKPQATTPQVPESSAQTQVERLAQSSRFRVISKTPKSPSGNQPKNKGQK